LVGATIAVLAPSISVSITIETASSDEDDIHIHAGGQGIWIARMLVHLGYDPQVCAPVGGESGRTLLGLTGEWGIDVLPIATIDETPAYVHDRRQGERVELARSRPPRLRRHEIDELYQRFLEAALSSPVCVVTGHEAADLLPTEFHRRLGADLAAADVPVVADLHGPDLDAFLEGGPIAVLKVSAGDLAEDGRLGASTDEPGTDEGAVAEAIATLVDRGVAAVVVSRGDRPTVARFGAELRLVGGPKLAVVDASGSGDSMTAALATSIVEDLEPDAALRRAWAAGAANVTRRGLGSGVPGLIEELAERVTITEWAPERSDRERRPPAT
jgi:1-phosphofructokinase